MKGVAESNQDRHKNSILTFKKVLQSDPENLMAIIGIGVGFGNFGEYKQAHKYFLMANEISPENHIVKNYKEFAENVIQRYPYNEVEGPKIFEVAKVEDIPEWIKNSAGWWAEDKITDIEFIASLQFLIKNNIIMIEDVQRIESNSTVLPVWIKNNAEWWAEDKITDQDFLSGIYYMIENGIIIIEIPEKDGITEEEQLVLDRNLWEYERYLDRVIKTVENDTRYIEYPNPSNDRFIVDVGNVFWTTISVYNRNGKLIEKVFNNSNISELIILTFSLNFFFRTSTSLLSFSIRINFLGFFSNIFSVRFPVPGPTSITISSLFILPSSTIILIIFLSTRKF